MRVLPAVLAVIVFCSKATAFMPTSHAGVLRVPLATCSSLWPRMGPRPHPASRMSRLQMTESSLALAGSGPGPQDDVIVLPSGFKMAVRVWGDPAVAPGRPQDRWLALHGWADNAASFDRLAPLLLEAGATCVVALDGAGHGLSEHRSSYHDVDNVVDVVAAAEAIGWANYSVIGHSLGGCVAQAVAATVPEKVQRLIVVEALGWFSHDAGGALRALRKKSLEAAAPASRGSWTAYKDLEAAAERRAKQNMAGPMAVDDARVLVARGTRACYISIYIYIYIYIYTYI